MATPKAKDIDNPVVLLEMMYRWIEYAAKQLEQGKFAGARRTLGHFKAYHNRYMELTSQTEWFVQYVN